ncbi:MAG: porin [Ignavibacteriales bacterium]|nr:porin [Ignavibacteriales bacterium]
MKTILSILKKLFFVCLIAVSTQTVIYPQDSEDTFKTTINGLLDVYYSNNFSNPVNKENKYRNFDVAENQFNVSLAKLTIQKQAFPIGFKLELAFGSTADIVQSAEQNKSLNFLQQAYVTALLPIGKGLTVNAGKMLTHMGEEVIESNLNPNYSRSLLFAYAVPYYHVGICASYPVLDNLSLTGYIYNGWNFMNDNNKEKTAGATINWSPVSNLTIIENWIGGIEQPDSLTVNARNVFDTIINLTLSDKFFLSFNADYGYEKQANGELAIWKGIAVTGKYSFYETSALALRCEAYSDPYGFTTGTVQDLKEITLTYEQKFFPNLLVRLEYRRDWSNVKVFDEGNKIGTKNDQNTILISSVISF